MEARPDRRLAGLEGYLAANYVLGGFLGLGDEVFAVVLYGVLLATSFVVSMLCPVMEFLPGSPGPGGLV